MSLIKNKAEIEKMRAAGLVVSKVLKRMQEMAAPGATTKEMDEEAERIIISEGARPSFKNYNGFRYATCMSVDDVVVHGFPSLRKLIEGEILSVDVGACLEGFHSDAARTFAIGRIEIQKQKLIEAAKESFFEGCKAARAGSRLGDVSERIQACVERQGFSVVRAMTGHGIGKKLHEDPVVLNYGKAGTGLVLKSGMALAVEPMINMGGYEVYIDPIDKWTCRTCDKSVSAHYENTIIITDNEPEILTLY